MKVLVLTRSTGEGHNAAAWATQEAFRSRGHTCDAFDAIQVVDEGKLDLYPPPLPVPSAVPAAPSTAVLPASAVPEAAPARRRRVVDVASALYGWAALKVPVSFGLVYAAGEAYTRTPVPSPVKVSNSRYAEATHAFIEEHHYDAVVATHLFPMATMTAIKRRFPTRAKMYAVLTDYTCIPFLSETRLDDYFVPHADVVDECRRRRMPPARLHAVGLPVMDAFRHPMELALARAKLGLPQEGPIYLLMSGGPGSQHLRTLCSALLNNGDAATHVVVLTGRREELYRQIAGHFRDDPRVHVMPFTHNVAEYMAAASVVISKPGGASSTEAAVMGVPLIHTGAIPGVETKNARFFADRGMSLYSPNLAEAARLATRLRHDAAAQARMRAAQKAFVPTDAGDRIVAHVEGARQ